MSDDNPQRPEKRIGQGMLVMSFALALVALTWFFDGWLAGEANPNRNPASFELQNGAREVLLERNRQGHYVVNGTLNGLPVTFLLDTGATDVAIPAAIAEQAGLEAGAAQQAYTANGAVRTYSTVVRSLEIGNIQLRDIRASITPSMAGEIILLGMSALRHVEFSQQGNILTLRQAPE
jgi:aspartyl protease family protein